MDDADDDAGYSSLPHRHKPPAPGFPSQALPPPRLRYSRGEDDEDDDDDDDEEPPPEEEEEEEEEEEDGDEEEEEEDIEGSEAEEEEPQPAQRNHSSSSDDDREEDDDDEGDVPERTDRPPAKRRRKRRRLDRIALGFEFAPRVAPPPAPGPPSRSAPRHSPADWSEDSTMVLLDVWGGLYVDNGRRSIRADEWAEVAKKVSKSSRTSRSEAQCRNRLDTLKKKYKKEKMRMTESSDPSSDWVYFSRIDALLSPPPAAAPRLACGFDSGEYVFNDSNVYVTRSNDLDEMRDTPEDSDEDDDDDDDEESDGLPPQRTSLPKKAGSSSSSSLSSFRMLADSIHKFGEIYEKIESSKRQQMAELERMRKTFHEDLELQKRQILERAQAEIAKIRRDRDEDDVDGHNNQDEDTDASLEEGSA
ncbi:alcohol dehydrogenase transcription factor Myb/SANT-like family protein [Wolffia australiana]